MLRTALQIENRYDYVAVNVEGMPIGHYTAQIFKLLSTHGLASVCQLFAHPVYYRRGSEVQWFYQGAATELLPWKKASHSQQLKAIDLLIEIREQIEVVRQQLPRPFTRSIKIIDQILSNLTIIPTTEAIFFTEHQPLVIYWGYFTAQHRAIELPQLQDSLQQLAVEELAQTPTDTLAPQPAGWPWSQWILALVFGFTLALTSEMLSYRAHPTSSPHTTLIPLQPDAVEVAVNRLVMATESLPVKPALLKAPTPVPQVIPVKRKEPLMIPALSRYRGDISFLNGDWVTTLAEQSAPITLRYSFYQGQAKTTAEVGAQRCQTLSKAAFTAKGDLVIASGRTVCAEGLQLPVLTLRCKKSQPNTQCVWLKNSSVHLPIALEREEK